MNEQQARRILQDYIRAQDVEAVDLWPVIHAKVKLSQARHSSESFLTRASSNIGRTRIATRYAAVILLLTIVLITGAGLGIAAVNGMIQRFGMVSVPLQPSDGTTSSEAAPVTPLSMSPAQRARPISIEAAQRQVPFHILQPSWLPESLGFTGALVGRGPFGADAGESIEEAKAKAPIQVLLIYRPTMNADANVTLQISDGKLSGGYGFPRERMQDVIVNGKPAVYVKGSWNEKSEWNDQVDAANLSWEDSDFTYVLSQYQLGLSPDEMIRIAESIR